MSPQVAFWAVVGLGLVHGFLNGIHDSGSLTAAVICSGAVGPRKALLVTAAAQFAGALLVGVAVARTIGQGIVVTRLITTPVVVAALIAAVLWNLLTWYLGLPSSTSHALIGALAGAVWLQSGLQAVSLSGLGAVLLILLFSPWVGFLASYLLMKLLMLALRSATPRVGARLKRIQLLLAPVVAFGHGANDAQKVMGIVALGLVSLGALSSFTVPAWLQVAAALSLAVGTALGGMRIMRTLGLRLYRMRPIHGFAAQSAAALVVVGASVLGGPVSTTQVIGASIAGAGSAQRASQVRWGVIGSIVVAWLLTIPAAGALAALVCALIVRI
ncbi:MAG: inorganic phosphate transporter [Anaerolineae bacterium]|nr:inorganic phosphate transporter [Anaerolineae bacterium]